MKKHLVNKLINSFARSHISRTTAETSAESSASVADVSQSNHSAVTSRNFRELSARLDDYLERTDSASGEVELDVVSMSRQIEKIEHYLNGSLPDSVERAVINDKHTKLIKVAAWTAKEAYASDVDQMSHAIPLESFSDYLPTEYSENITASYLDGTVKATRVRLFSLKEKPSARLLVVAIRGSTSKRRDWTINFDEIGQGTDGEGFIDVDDNEIQVHGGFLDCAKAMVEKVSSTISSVLSQSGQEEDKGEVQILFTGHSAGGAVATLLYSHMTSTNSSELSDLAKEFKSIHCVVFGAPPVTTPALRARGPDSILYSIINEGDPVPRIDKDYAESLIRLYISPVPETPSRLELPKMLLENSGIILFLKNGLQGFSSVPGIDGQKENKTVLETTISGNPRAHKMDMYLWKLELLGDTL